MSYQPDKVELILDWTGGEQTLTVLVDQRDLAAWEGCDVNIPDRAQAITATRWMAWNAARRAGQFDKDMTWEKFSDTCLKASVVSEPAPEEDDTDPLAG